MPHLTCRASLEPSGLPAAAATVTPVNLARAQAQAGGSVARGGAAAGRRHCEGAMIRALVAKASFITWKTAVLSTKAPSQP